MTIKELRDKLTELVEAGRGDRFVVMSEKYRVHDGETADGRVYWDEMEKFVDITAVTDSVMGSICLERGV